MLAPNAHAKHREVVAIALAVILGHKTVANFETYSYPQLGSYLIGIFVVGVLRLAFAFDFFR